MVPPLWFAIGADMIGWPSPNSSVKRVRSTTGALFFSLTSRDLDVGELELGEGLAQRLLLVPEPAGEPLDDRRQRIDGQPGIVEVGRLLVEVDGGELEQADGVVGDDERGGRLG